MDGGPAKMNAKLVKEQKRRDEKLKMFVIKTLEDGPPSSENEELSPMAELTSFEAQCQINQSYRGNNSVLMDVTNTTITEESIGEDSDTYFFPQTNNLDRECMAIHMRRLRRENQRQLHRKQQPQKQCATTVPKLDGKQKANVLVDEEKILKSRRDTKKKNVNFEI